jgi:hypothetical protein
VQGAFREKHLIFRGFPRQLYNNVAVICPLCGTRKARRGCPAVGQQICAVCCGTKRLVQINCPADCTWLASAREHPPAAIVRQQQRDLSQIVHFMRDFNQRQSQLFFLIHSFVAGYQPPELQPLVDEDVAEAVDAIASTLETASRGVIYDHRPASLPAERLATALKPVLTEAGKGAGSSFERDTAVVLRRIAESARELRAQEPDNRRVFLGLVGRVIRKPDSAALQASGNPGEHEQTDPASRLIVP